jgi:Mn-dependent DtxR family transcriptional regulator
MTPRKSTKPALNRSESTEDHLERIQELIEQKGYARVADLADILHLSTSAVSNMVRRLARRGFVNYERYRGFTLTHTGRQVAHHVRARHQTLSEFLELVGLDAETVDREVEEIEHHLRPETLKLLSQLIAFWRAQPEQLEAFRRFSGKVALKR